MVDIGSGAGFPGLVIALALKDRKFPLKVKLIEKNSGNLNMQDLGLFWQLTLRTIEDLKVVSNEEVALEMFLMQLMHLKSLEDYSREKNFENIDQMDSKITKQKIENNIKRNQSEYRHYHSRCSASFHKSVIRGLQVTV